MRLTHDGIFERNDIWREGKWFDLWSVVHFFTGVSTAFGLSIFNFGFLATAVIAFLGFVVYELWEAMVKIEETPQNRAMDVAVGMVSLVPTFLFVVPLLPMPQFVVAFTVVLVANVGLAYIGWRASQKAEVIETKMRLEIAKQREKFIHRHDAFRARRRQRRNAKDARTP